MMIDLELADKPEVHHIAGLLGIDPDAVVGKLVRVWSWFDKQTVDGHAPSVTHALLNRLTARDGFAEAMAEAGWLLQETTGLRMPKFDSWNGQSAKKRALSNRRQSKKRHAEVTPESRTERDKNVTREEKRRSKPPVVPREYSAAFEAFWKAWPANERKQSRPKCWEAWQRQGGEQIADRIMAHVGALMRSDGWQRGFVPAPLVYLNQSRWDGAEVELPLERKVSMPC